MNPGKLRLKGMLGGGTVVQISVRGGFPPYELSVAGVGSVTDERLETAGTTQYGYLIPGNVSAGEETAVIRVSDAAGHNVTCPVAVEIHEALSVKPVSAGLSGSPGETVSVSVSVEGGFAPYILSVNGPGVVAQARLGEPESTVYSYTIPDDSQPGKKRAEIQIRDEQENIVRCRVSIRIF